MFWAQLELKSISCITVASYSNEVPAVSHALKVTHTFSTRYRGGDNCCHNDKINTGHKHVTSLKFDTLSIKVCRQVLKSCTVYNTDKLCSE